MPSEFWFEQRLRDKLAKANEPPDDAMRSLRETIDDTKRWATEVQAFTLDQLIREAEAVYYAKHQAAEADAVKYKKEAEGHKTEAAQAESEAADADQRLAEMEEKVRVLWDVLEKAGVPEQPTDAELEALKLANPELEAQVAEFEAIGRELKAERAAAAVVKQRAQAAADAAASARSSEKRARVACNDARQLREGDYVEVTSGDYSGRCGIMTRVDRHDRHHVYVGLSVQLFLGMEIKGLFLNQLEAPWDPTYQIIANSAMAAKEDDELRAAATVCKIDPAGIGRRQAEEPARAEQELRAAMASADATRLRKAINAAKGLGNTAFFEEVEKMDAGIRIQRDVEKMEAGIRIQRDEDWEREIMENGAFLALFGNKNQGLESWKWEYHAQHSDPRPTVDDCVEVTSGDYSGRCGKIIFDDHGPNAQYKVMFRVFRNTYSKGCLVSGCLVGLLEESDVRKISVDLALLQQARAAIEQELHDSLASADSYRLRNASKAAEGLVDVVLIKQAEEATPTVQARQLDAAVAAYQARIRPVLGPPDKPMPEQAEAAAGRGGFLGRCLGRGGCLGRGCFPGEVLYTEPFTRLRDHALGRAEKPQPKPPGAAAKAPETAGVDPVLTLLGSRPKRHGKWFTVHESSLPEIEREEVCDIHAEFLQHHPNGGEKTAGFKSVKLNDQLIEKYRDRIRISSYRWKDFKGLGPKGDQFVLPGNYLWFLEYVRERKLILWMEYLL